ncbi:MAG: TetR/AcrR family transcriptional regulator [Chitinophagales bacterium]
METSSHIHERIQAKAHELYMQYGIRSVSMDDIANALGMSKKTLYLYFADKDELVDAVVEAQIALIQKDCVNCRKDAHNAVHEMFISMDRIVEQFSNMNPMVLHDLAKFHFRAFQRFREHKDKFLMKIIRENIEWGKKEGLYRADADTEILCRFRLESMMLPFQPAVFPVGKNNLAELCSQIMEHFVFGLVTVKGHKMILKFKQDQKSSSHEKTMVI